MNMKNLFAFSLFLFLLVGCKANESSLTSAEKNIYAQKLVISPNDMREYKTLKLSNEIEVVLVGIVHVYAD